MALLVVQITAKISQRGKVRGILYLVIASVLEFYAVT